MIKSEKQMLFLASVGAVLLVFAGMIFSFRNSSCKKYTKHSLPNPKNITARYIYTSILVEALYPIY